MIFQKRSSLHNRNSSPSPLPCGFQKPEGTGAGMVAFCIPRIQDFLAYHSFQCLSSIFTHSPSQIQGPLADAPADLSHSPQKSKYPPLKKKLPSLEKRGLE
ncbi:hypothetical protein TWF225_002262 [Orbilia oligospora]|uniref:Uncharacterized protein n=1 Tax=Orbilia oligospora TaxID=2813651 RepID=A0A7C8PQ54_ORBOL|nr:hypothetical protein TWF751_006325 [Orbilia oligospora]KAF3190517.1 hypothetical protein TWF225_002262 [Orbilia oligospora]KAF3236362.1 hypothetical protein TWF128_001378 [Orbilia oligospora]KAF3242201.1 hypothetical protein TWF217_011843 [Orbilia oligospora]KAF3280377.1 hypothetical protein TWF132_011749 [Orbilia oligospora]